MRSSSMFWGGLLILIGFVLVLSNLGVLGNIDIWDLIWPVFLILLGAWFIFGTLTRRPVQTERVVIALGEAQSAHLHVQHGAGRLEIRAGASPGNLVEGDFGGGLDYSTQKKGDQLAVRMRVPPQFVPIFWYPGHSLDWSFSLAKDFPLTMDVSSGANEARLDFTEVNLKKLTVKSGVSSTRIDLPAAAGQTQVNVESGVSSVHLNVPEGVAARIRSQGGLSSLEVDRSRFPKVAGYYQSSDYEQAQNKVDIFVQMGIGSVSIK